MQTLSKVEPRVVTLWRIKAIIRSVLFLLVLTAIILIIEFFIESSLSQRIKLALYTVTVLYSLYSIFLAPSLKRKYWRYGFSDDQIMIKTGIWFRNQITIPVLRVQNIESNVGPIASKLDLVALRITTAADGHKLPEMNTQNADTLQKSIQMRIQNSI